MTSGISGRVTRLTPRARALLPVFLTLLVALAVRQLWCAAPPRSELIGSVMGTYWSVVLASAGRSRNDVESARVVVEAAFAAVDQRMSTWDPESELSRFNRHASSEAFPLSPDTLEVFAIALAVSERSGGAFDATVRPLVAAWGFGANARTSGAEPSPAELASLRTRVGFQLLELSPATGTARKRHPQLECDLSAVAKGYAVDRAAEALTGLGFSDFLVELGGEVRVRGERPGGGPWRVAIEQPDPDIRQMRASIELRDGALATSGDYRSFYERDGVRFSHLLDPRSGRPVQHGLASVSVVHRQAAFADAWATALSVLGTEEGFALAEAEGLGAYFIDSIGSGGFVVRATSGFPSVRTMAIPAEGPPSRDMPEGRP